MSYDIFKSVLFGLLPAVGEALEDNSDWSESGENSDSTRNCFIILTNPSSLPSTRESGSRTEFSKLAAFSNSGRKVTNIASQLRKHPKFNRIVDIVIML